MIRRLLLAAVTAAVPALLLIPAAGVANAAAAPACPGVIAIQQLAFSPPSVPAGQTSALNLVVANCTGQTVSGQVAWYGHFTGPGGAIAPGCPVLDPFVQPYTIAPDGTYQASPQYGDTLPSCQATGLQITVQLTVASNPAAAVQATATLGITQASPPPLACHVSYAASTWPGGFTASVTISDTGTAPINGWTLAFTFPGDQKITNAWNATVTQAGAGVSAANLFYNATIPPGGSQSFGFQGTWATNGTAPASFTVNGAACS
jgi:Cellulose binding domain